MRLIPNQIITSLILLLFMGWIQGCIDEVYVDEDPEEELIKEGKNYVVLGINTLSDGSAQTSGVQEKIKSMRVIMLSRDVNDTEGKEIIELNEKIDFPNNPLADNSFVYYYSREVSAGIKSFYLIANEEEVRNLSFNENSSLSTDIPRSSLSEFLKYFKVAKPKESDEVSEDNKYDESCYKMAASLREAMEAVYFIPDYSISNNTVNLPYSAYYPDFRVTGADSPYYKDGYYETSMYLVPVAVKFDFNFINYRKNDVQIENIKISKINTATFLNAHLSEEEQTRQLDEKEVWWIDWLAACSKGSQNAEDLGSFNSLWGWIKEYTIPVETESDLKDINKSPASGSFWILDALQDLSNPDRLTIGPYYFVESRNMVEKDKLNDEGTAYETEMIQSYSLQFKVHDVIIEEITETEEIELPNVVTLFRATHAIIDIRMYDSMVDIYVEIAPWELKTFQGYVSPVEDDD